MSPTTLHTCLQGPLSARKPHGSQRPRSSGVQAEGLGAREPRSCPISQGHPFHPLTHRLGSGTSPNTPLPQVTGTRVRRRQKEDGGEERKGAENVPHVSERRLRDAWAGKDCTLSVLQKARLKAAHGPSWGHTRLAQAAPPILTSRSSSPNLRRRGQRTPDPEQQHALGGPPRTRPAPGAPRLPTASLPLQVLGCGTGSAMVLGATWEDSGLSADSSAASGLGRSPSVTEQTGGASRVFRRPQALTGAMRALEVGGRLILPTPILPTGEETEAQGGTHLRPDPSHS